MVPTVDRLWPGPKGGSRDPPEFALLPPSATRVYFHISTVQLLRDLAVDTYWTFMCV